MIRCRNGELYTGITTDIARRFRMHQCGKGAKYLRGKQPLELVFQQDAASQREALQQEIAIKRLSKKEKEAIVTSNLTINRQKK